MLSMKDVILKLLIKAGPFLGLILVIAAFSLPAETRESFLTFNNFKIILTQTVIVAVAALGMTMIIVSGGIDLSVGSSIALTGVAGALMAQAGWGTWPIVGTMILAGMGIGAINGLAIVSLRVVPFIVTLGTLCVARGGAMILAKNETVNYPDLPINHWMSTPDPFSYALPTGVWVVLGLAVFMAFVLKRTVFGRHVFALGSNESTARLCGLPTQRLKVMIYAVAGGFFGLAGVFQLSRLGQGDPSIANGLELDIIAAVIIGGASLNGGVGTILGSMIGALIMAVLRNGSGQMGWSTGFQLIIIGLVIMAAVFIDRLRQSRDAARA